MARAGVYRSEILAARNRLIAQGRYPSVDAVREELGNTGSKGTIHRHLKDIEEEEGGTPGSRVRLSEPIQDLVARLAERLKFEAQDQIEVVKAAHSQELAQLQQAKRDIEQEANSLRNTLAETQAALQAEREERTRVAEQLREEALEHAQATQRVTDLQLLLRTEETHRQSLEEKHAHAREALEHFRTASSTQREQELRQHDQQVQYLQGEIRTLRDNLVQAQNDAATSKEVSARLSADLARAERAQHEAAEELRGLKNVKGELVSTQQHAQVLGSQLAQLQTDFERQQAMSADLQTARIADRAEIQNLQIDLAAARAARETQDQLTEKIQLWFDRKPRGGGQKAAAR